MAQKPANMSKSNFYCILERSEVKTIREGLKKEGGRGGGSAMGNFPLQRTWAENTELFLRTLTGEAI